MCMVSEYNECKREISVLFATIKLGDRSSTYKLSEKLQDSATKVFVSNFETVIDVLFPKEIKNAMLKLKVGNLMVTFEHLC